MQTIKEGVASLSLIARLNLDRFLVLGLTCIALFCAGYIITL